MGGVLACRERRLNVMRGTRAGCADLHPPHPRRPFAHAAAHPTHGGCRPVGVKISIRRTARGNRPALASHCQRPRACREARGPPAPTTHGARHAHSARTAGRAHTHEAVCSPNERVPRERKACARARPCGGATTGTRRHGGRKDGGAVRPATARQRRRGATCEDGGALRRGAARRATRMARRGGRRDGPP